MVDGIKGPGGIDPKLFAPDQIGQAGSKGGAKAFGEMLKDSINEVNKVQHEAAASVEKLAKGETKNIHDTMIAAEKASVSFNMMIQVRNKLLSAYEEVMRMQV